jgi:hypothetical protein
MTVPHPKYETSRFKYADRKFGYADRKFGQGASHLITVYDRVTAKKDESREIKH